jgi:hypothetical protein
VYHTYQRMRGAWTPFGARISGLIAPPRDATKKQAPGGGVMTSMTSAEQSPGSSAGESLLVLIRSSGCHRNDAGWLALEE